MEDVVANINIIVAASDNDCIGVKGDLPWNLPTDLKRFKEITNNHIVIMGRKTWESIPEKYRPLPNRTNVIITKNLDYKADGAEVRHDLIKALDEFAWGNHEVFVIGGAQIYKEAFPYANKLYLTRVMTEIEGDTFLEGLEPSDWLLLEFEGPYKEDEYDYRFEQYKRKENGNNKTNRSEAESDASD
jgi:dihydrofolate reductase